jgi:GT2 family glycosyltransferase
MSSTLDIGGAQADAFEKRAASHDLAIITVSTNEAQWIRPCLRSVFDHIGDVSVDVVVVDNESDDGTAEMVGDEFPAARVVRSRNHGFSHANNRGLMTCNARYVLFLNPDTEILEGTFAELVRMMDARPAVGLIGVRQITGEGRLDETIRRFPNALRALGDALSAERLPRRPRWLGEREVDPAAYERETPCDWTSGSFMLARREAIESAGFMDERFFMYSEETDFCLRIKTAGWRVRHFPWMTILHLGAKAGVEPRIESLAVHSRVVYARKHFSRVQRTLYFMTLFLRHSLRFVCSKRDGFANRRRAANAAAIKTLLGLSRPPHSPWSTYSVCPREPALTDEEATEMAVAHGHPSAARGG